MTDKSTLSPGSGSTVSGSTTSSIGSSGSNGSSNFSDTSRPTGSTTTSSSSPSSGGSFSSSGTNFQPDTTPSYTPETSNYRSSDRQVTYAEQPRSRPSTAVIAGAALAGAITGGAIPFFFAGRKSSQKSQTTFDQGRDDDFEGRGDRSALFNKGGTGNRF